MRLAIGYWPLNVTDNRQSPITNRHFLTSGPPSPLQPNATSSIIIKAKPSIRPSVAMSACFPV